MNKTVKILGSIVIVAIIFVSIFLFLGESNKTFVGNQQNSINTQQTEPDELSTNEVQQNMIIKNNEIIYRNYINPEFNIKLLYPDNYKLQEGVMGTVAIFLSKKESSDDLFQENLNVIVQDLSAQPMTLEEYNDLSLGQIESFFTDVKIISSNKTTLAGKSAYEVIYTGKQGQYNLKWKQIWTVIDNNAYVLSYTAEENKFNDFLEIFNSMFNSFEILN